MRTTLRSLRSVIRQTLLEASGRSGFYDQWFLEKLPGVLANDSTLKDVGQQLGYGNEHVVFAYGSNVIKFRPVYEYSIEYAQDLLKAAESSELNVLASGIINDSDNSPFAVWFVMPRYKKLSREEEDLIDSVVAGHTLIDDVEEPSLRKFLKRYVTLPGYDLAGNNIGYDLAGNNVMKDGDEYVVSDI